MDKFNIFIKNLMDNSIYLKIKLIISEIVYLAIQKQVL